MAHRDVSISLFGVMAGVLLGAGSLALVNVSSFDASVVSYVPDSLHPAALATFNRRNINRTAVPRRSGTEVSPYPTVKTESSSSALSVPEAVVTPSCASVKAAIAKIQMAFNAVTPINVRNTDVRQKMAAAFADTLDDYCDTAVQSSSSAPAAEATRTDTIDNHCESYPTYTARYSQCVVNQGLGRKFP